MCGCIPLGDNKPDTLHAQDEQSAVGPTICVTDAQNQPEQLYADDQLHRNNGQPLTVLFDMNGRSCLCYQFQYEHGSGGYVRSQHLKQQLVICQTNTPIGSLMDTIIW